jgi:hypothetical protein
LRRGLFSIPGGPMIETLAIGGVVVLGAVFLAAWLVA